MPNQIIRFEEFAPASQPCGISVTSFVRLSSLSKLFLFPNLSSPFRLVVVLWPSSPLLSKSLIPFERLAPVSHFSKSLSTDSLAFARFSSLPKAMVPFQRFAPVSELLWCLPPGWLFFGQSLVLVKVSGPFRAVYSCVSTLLLPVDGFVLLLI